MRFSDIEQEQTELARGQVLLCFLCYLLFMIEGAAQAQGGEAGTSQRH